MAITGYTHPPELERWIEELVPDYAPVSGIEIFEDWRRPDLAERIALTVADRRVALEAILERHPVDVVWAVLEAPDRLQHAYYKYLAPTESAWGSPEAREPRDAVMRALAEVDRIVGLLDAYAGPQGVAIVCSDHGATGWEGYAFGNVLLARAGLLQLRSSARVLRTIGASGFGAIARRFVPTRVTYRVRRRVQSLIDQRRTQAYAMLLGSQGFSVNLAGREASGAVPRGEMESVVADLMGALRGARTPQGDPLFSSIRRREQVYEGPFADEAPDVVVETVGSRWEVSDALATKELFQDLSALPLGCHEPNGIFALRAPGVVPATARHARIEDLLPTLLYAAGAAVPEGLDGEPRRDLFGAAAPAVTLLPSNLIGASTRGGSPYSREEEALITKYLTDLGYLG
jgi:predicted AlkP superfamily phosphohydrolase/phosphomutase